MTDAIVLRESEVLPKLHRPVADLAGFKQARAEWEAFIQSEMKPGLDYYKLEGYTKDALSKAGAENLLKAHGFKADEAEFVDRTEDWSRPFFRYLVRVIIRNRATNETEGVGLGECNSHEKKYRWRWVAKEEVPEGLDPASLLSRDATLSEFTFAVDKAETRGKYGKPPEYWAQFKEAIASGTARKGKRKTKQGKEYETWDIGSRVYRVPNDDAASLVNTLIKMAKKRAYEDAVLTATGMSDRFTQYEEDEEGDETAKPAEPGAPVPAEQPAAPPGSGEGGASPPSEYDQAVAAFREVREALGLSLDQTREEIVKLWPSTKGGDGKAILGKLSTDMVKTYTAMLRERLS